MKLPAFDYRNPATVAEAIRILSEEQGSAKVIAGGQTLIPIMAFRLASPSVLVDLARIPGLDRIDIDERGLTIGAMVCWRDIEDDVRLRAEYPLLVAAVAHIAHYQIRNRGTVGGSLAHADPAAEMPGIAVTCDAQIEITGPHGIRCVDAGDFFRGTLTTDLTHEELITSIRFPPWSGRRRWAFDEFAPRRGDFAFAGIAVHFDEAENGVVADAHVGVIGATSVPRRLAAVEQLINGTRLDEAVLAAAARTAAEAVDPEGDIHASAAYRRALVGTLVERTLVAALQRDKAS
jgi:carbon-monoxide dehydrogenase medium subunit